MTLRQLVAMDRGRCEFVGEQIGYLCAWIALKLTGEKINPDQLNPYGRSTRPRVVKEKTPEEIEYQNRRSWKLLDAYFEQHK